MLKLKAYVPSKEFPFFIHRMTHHIYRTPMVHDHDFVEMVYVVSGKAKHMIDNETFELRSGDVFFINPGEAHTFIFEPSEQIDIINCMFFPQVIPLSHFHELQLTSSLDYFYVHPFLDHKERFIHLLNLSGMSSMRVLSLLENMLHDYANQTKRYPRLIKIQLIELLILLSDYYEKMQDLHPSTSVDPSDEYTLIAKRVHGYMERNYEQKITLENLSSLFAISPRQLQRLVKNETGLSVIRLLQKIRIEKAKYLLWKTDGKINRKE